MGGGIIMVRLHPARTALRPRSVPVQVIRCREGSGQGWPARRGAPRPARSAAAAGHGIVNESDDIAANWRQELPGGDLHGFGKGILAN
jgi:hypothetical protein